MPSSEFSKILTPYQVRGHGMVLGLILFASGVSLVRGIAPGYEALGVPFLCVLGLGILAANHARRGAKRLRDSADFAGFQRDMTDALAFHLDRAGLLTSGAAQSVELYLRPPRIARARFYITGEPVVFTSTDLERDFRKVLEQHVGTLVGRIYAWFFWIEELQVLNVTVPPLSAHDLLRIRCDARWSRNED